MWNGTHNEATMSVMMMESVQRMKCERICKWISGKHWCVFVVVVVVLLAVIV